MAPDDATAAAATTAAETPAAETTLPRPTAPAQTVPAATLRDRALRRLKKRRDFHAHLLVYVLVNAFLVTIWAMTGSGFFWPVFPMVFWGIGVVMNAWDVYHSDEFSENEIAREMARLRRPS